MSFNTGNCEYTNITDTSFFHIVLLPVDAHYTLASSFLERSFSAAPESICIASLTSSSEVNLWLNEVMDGRRDNPMVPDQSADGAGRVRERRRLLHCQCGFVSSILMISFTGYTCSSWFKPFYSLINVFIIQGLSATFIPSVQINPTSSRCSAMVPSCNRASMFT